MLTWAFMVASNRKQAFWLKLDDDNNRLNQVKFHFYSSEIVNTSNIIWFNLIAKSYSFT